MTEIKLKGDAPTPPCPVCAGETMLKDMRKLPRATGYMCFFHCLSCGTEYPRPIESADAVVAADPGKAAQPPSRDGV